MTRLLFLFSVLISLPAYGQSEGKVVDKTPLDPGRIIKDVYWSDGGSGRLDGIRFRIKNYDAPETKVFRSKETGEIMPVGAQCPKEAFKGNEARLIARNLSRLSERIVVTANYGKDRYDRWLVDLSLDVKGYATEMLQGRYLQYWDYDAGDDKSDWCGES